MKKKHFKRLLFGIPLDTGENLFNSSEEKIAFVKKWLGNNNPLGLEVLTEEGKIVIVNPKPRSIDIELTNHCNARCIFCPQDLLPKKGFMEENLFTAIIEKVKKSHISRIMFIGRGEPLLHPKILKFIKYIKTESGLPIEIFTNAHLLTKSLIDRLSALNDSIINIRINVSLHSLVPSTYNRIVGLSLEKIAENLKYLMKNSELAYCISFVKNKITETEMVNLRRYLDRLGITSADISLIYNKGGLINDSSVLDMNFYERNLPKSAIQAWQKDPLCSYTYSHYSYYVNYRGEFTLCHSDYTDTLRIGHILENSFEEIDEKVEKIKASGGNKQCRICTKKLRELFHGEERDEALLKDKIVI